MKKRRSRKKFSYGGIRDPEAYLAERYGGSRSAFLVRFIKGDRVDNLAAGKRQMPLACTWEKRLQVNMDSMARISGRKTNNCVLAAVSRLISYYRGKDFLQGAPCRIQDIYQAVEKMAESGHLYSDRWGVLPTRIKKLTRLVFDRYRCRIRCRAVYLWSFNRTIRPEIDAGRPVILNILRGYYKMHSIVVTGYCIYRLGGRPYVMLQAADGWNEGTRYVDYRALAFDFLHAGIASANQVVPLHVSSMKE